MTIILASNNGHKRSEMEGIFRDRGATVELVQPREIGLTFDVVEDGATFADNAFIKARALAMLLRGEVLPGVSHTPAPDEIARAIRDRFDDAVPPVLADDSGICVHALDNRPGVYSARYGNEPNGKTLDDEERNALLLRELGSLSDRTAHYVCNAVLYFCPDRYLQVQESWHGEINDKPVYGETGFGYDPVFLVPEYRRTVAQIPQKQKDRISHRAKAVGTILQAAGWADPGN